jgi:hypothetical protein
MKTRKTSVPPQGLTINALSEQTGIDRRTLKKRLTTVKQQPGGGYLLADVEAAAKAGAEGGSLRDEKLREEIRKLRIQNDQKERELVNRRDVAGAIRKTLPEIPKILDQKLVQEAPTPEEKIRARKAIDEAVRVIEQMAKDWAI